MAAIYLDRIEKKLVRNIHTLIFKGTPKITIGDPTALYSNAYFMSSYVKL